jgi:hypothetical protein
LSKNQKGLVAASVIRDTFSKKKTFHFECPGRMLAQEDEIQRDQRRVQALAERNEKRTARFLDARNRTIGIDKASLDKQVEEKFQQQILAKKQKQCEVEANSLLVLHLTNAARKAQEIQQRKTNEVNATLLQQLNVEKNNAIQRGEPVDVDCCGPSSMQLFTGEDEELALRKKNQQEQVKTWYAWQIYERDIIKKLEEEQKVNYIQSVSRQEEVREQIEKEISSERAKRVKDIQLENLKSSHQASQKQLDNISYIPFILEGSTDSRGSSDRVSADQFRGFGVEQVRSIYKENLLIAEEKLRHKHKEEEEEKNRVANEVKVREELEQIAQLQGQRRLANNRALAEAWEQQRNELRIKQRKLKEDRFGTITDGFFQRFGTSCR